MSEWARSHTSHPGVTITWTNPGVMERMKWADVGSNPANEVSNRTDLQRTKGDNSAWEPILNQKRQLFPEKNDILTKKFNIYFQKFNILFTPFQPLLLLNSWGPSQQQSDILRAVSCSSGTYYCSFVLQQLYLKKANVVSVAAVLLGHFGRHIPVTERGIRPFYQ